MAVYNIYNALSGGEDGGLDCSRLSDDDSEVFDGRDMLQYAIYEIIKGPHEGKKILSCKCPWPQVPLKRRPPDRLISLISTSSSVMGTDFSNVEQVAAGM